MPVAGGKSQRRKGVHGLMFPIPKGLPTALPQNIKGGHRKRPQRPLRFLPLLNIQ